MKDYKLVKHEDYIELFEDGKCIYYKNSEGYSNEKTYDDNGRILTFKNSEGYSWVRTYDDKGNELTCKSSEGYSSEDTYDDKGVLLTRTVNGKLILDKRPKEVTIELTQERRKEMKAPLKQMMNLLDITKDVSIQEFNEEEIIFGIELMEK